MSRLLLSLLILFAIPALTLAQSSSELKGRQQKLREDIRYKEKLLQQIEQDTKSSSTKITLINKKIGQREELILSLKDEIVLIDHKIVDIEDLVDALEVDIERLKDEYSKMVVQAYKTRNGADKIMYIFASDDFSQAYRRLKYLQQLSEYRQRQAEAIIHTQKSLEKKRLDLEVRRTEKNQVLGEQNEEKLTLNREKQDKEKQLVLLTSQESKFKNELDVAQRKSEELRVAIKRAIERELAARSDESGGGGFNLTPEARELGKSFAANKGKLPWPIDKGEITALFGEQPHAFLKGIKVKNNGVTISTTDGSRARAVFDGEVSKIIILPGAGKVVMIRHGEYISIYTNLKETFVSTGDKVKTKEEIGIVVTDQGKTEFEFQLWKGTVLTDPSYWIYKGR
ncbi:MAG: peptidoglycan DD-metalloendopeptidase family protein [Flavobacteriales bacterium]|jgi:septal ring factor EnvC (AmiA/AmiB activator)|nr:peptidoglycan DD-metalloendopeptidase family protein [Flavobacteriales bacterium]MBT3963614.1 peptidoglycan DD-metalloendopeptidase family protein [Flavobacteriales bacterium]MBT4706124.1 peptidoglycan DD-metalloendopeptidase family protein [Flavobacteriales bacterium]MBT4930629.1 peptidoglycan DD-metalloendopeptidase family protein [Flavobacteriales bacterium]MBT5133309.1 peptidoglycan DD-metalloendopeptidase family protein [Flavobacteriales bacterium]